MSEINFVQVVENSFIPYLENPSEREEFLWARIKRLNKTKDIISKIQENTYNEIMGIRKNAREKT